MQCLRASTQTGDTGPSSSAAEWCYHTGHLKPRCNQYYLAVSGLMSNTFGQRGLFCGLNMNSGAVAGFGAGLFYYDPEPSAGILIRMPDLGVRIRDLPAN
jgi:hypothetical protein